MNPLLHNLNLRLEHAALQSEVDEATVRKLCWEAAELHLYAAVVNPVWVKVASGLLLNTGVRVVSVVGFPLGASRTDIKVAEAVEAVEDGADEIDMVANIGWLCSDHFSDVETEIRKLRRNLPNEIPLKVIIEAGKLTSTQQSEATVTVAAAGAQFVKTSTGFFSGATVDQVRTLVAAAQGRIQVKASGGIRTINECLVLLEAGATRLGSSSSVSIMAQYNAAFTSG